jgi:hypothetical protein
MTKGLFLIVFLLMIFTFGGKAQNYYWVAFTDKNDSRFSISNPEEFLSERAIERRLKQGINIDSLDLPVNQEYIDAVVNIGAEYIHSSKWLNGVTVKALFNSFENKAIELPFVKEVQLTKITGTKSAFRKFDEHDSGLVPIDTSLYGRSVYQTSTLNGQFLHNQNYNGEGIQIAVLDAGFYNANIYSAMDSLWANNQILGTRDFVDPQSDIFQTHYHGMSVLSCMGGNEPGKLIGTATKASYWLVRSEDAGSEYLIEEDNWVAAAEFVDSAGVDIINSSLGYYEFDDPAMNHTYADMNGNTTRVTQGANIAASKGILVVSSAGNEGNDKWKYIIAPADGTHVLGVGAVGMDSIPAFFTSFGPAYGGAVKPNVTAIGLRAVAQRADGAIGYINGTSFSGPVVAGMAASLWQANPHATSKQLKAALELSAHLYENPDSLMGYGLPDMRWADILLKNLSATEFKKSKKWLAFPNPVNDRLILKNQSMLNPGEIFIEMYSVDGKLIKKWVKQGASQIELRNLQSVPSGILILKISSLGSTETIKLSKVH